MKEFLTKNFVSLIVIILLIVLYLQRCTAPTPSNLQPKEIHDTTVKIIQIYHDTTIISKPVIINHIVAATNDIPKPDSTYIGLRKQYDSLSQEYYAKNIQKDSIKIDSIGAVSTTDTVQRNQIIGRKWDYNIRERLITQTITNTIYPKQKLQLYVGLGVMGEREKLVNGAEVSILLKNRKDQMFGISAQGVVGVGIEYTLSSYWKLHLRQ